MGGRLIFLGSNVTDYGQLRKLAEFAPEDVITRAQTAALRDCLKHLREEEMSDIFSEIYQQSGKYNQAHPRCMERTFYQLYFDLMELFAEEDVREKFRKEYYYTYLEARNFQQIFQKLFLLFEKYIEEEHKKLKEKLGKPLGVKGWSCLLCKAK